MVYNGRRYLVVGQYLRCNTMFLQCVENPGDPIQTFPATITDFLAQSEQDAVNLEMKTLFTIQGLNDVAFILDNALKASTK